MGGGPFGGGGGGSTDDDDDEEPAQTDVTSFEDEESPETDESTDGSAAGAGATVVGAAAATGAGTAGGGGAGGSTGSPGDGDGEGEPKEPCGGEDEPEGDPSDGISGEPEPCEPDRPKAPEDQTDDLNEEELCREDQEADHDAEPEKREEEPEDEKDEEDEPDDDDEEDEDDEEKEAAITVTTNPWDNTGWGMEPVLERLQHTYGDQLEITYVPGPVCSFDAAEVYSDSWRESADRHGMPTDVSVWTTNPPTSTELSTRALNTALEQSQDLFQDYLRLLRVEVQVKGKNIEEEALLTDLAAEVGLDTVQFKEDWENVEVDDSLEIQRMPSMYVEIDGYPRTWEGYVEYDRAVAAFTSHAMKPEPVFQSIPAFVEEYGPVTTEEVMTVFQIDRETAVENLQRPDHIVSDTFDAGPLWKVTT